MIKNSYTIAGETSLPTRTRSSSTLSGNKFVITVKSRPTRAKGVGKEEIFNAVYSHIRAIRSLGRSTVNTSDIARALGLALSDVQESITRLKSKGVKLAP